jgi:saccharopine dehydrogenase (NADP+, L-glutamate forming)
MKNIVIFGAGKSATSLIDYLGKVCLEKNWNLVVCDADLPLAQSKIGGYTKAKAVSVEVSDESKRRLLILQADVVISMLPPHLHFLIANDCLQIGRHLLNASYVDEKIEKLSSEIKERGLLFLCEMGLDPGIDHMSAMKIIHQVKNKGGKIQSFKSHCGGLVSPESDDNPWHYKITWNPANIVMAGSSGAVFKEDGIIKEIPYQKIFHNCKIVDVPGLFPLAWYPNRDSLSYIKTYGLQGMDTFIRTTLRHPSFCLGWNNIVNMGLTATNDHESIKHCTTYKEWFQRKKQIVKNNCIENENSMEFREQVAHIGLQSNHPMQKGLHNSANILQQLLEDKLGRHPQDKDMIVMLHEIGYELNGEKKKTRSCLIVKGEDQQRTAMAKTVGLPLGIAAKLILEGKIAVTGLQIPVIPEIYEPVLQELGANKINFAEEIL